MKEKEYAITFATDFSDYEINNDYYDSYSINKKIMVCRKYKGKTITLSEIPAFVSEVGRCVIYDEEIEIYNDYRE